MDFAIWELHIFLDTHPNNRRALKTYNDYVEKRMILAEEYEEKFGPLHLGREETDKWTWIKSCLLYTSATTPITSMAGFLRQA